jgi:hypothetical protein
VPLAVDRDGVLGYVDLDVVLLQAGPVRADHELVLVLGDVHASCPRQEVAGGRDAAPGTSDAEVVEDSGGFVCEPLERAERADGGRLLASRRLRRRGGLHFHGCGIRVFGRHVRTFLAIAIRRNCMCTR